MSYPHQLAWTLRGLTVLRRLLALVIVLFVSTFGVPPEVSALGPPVSAIHDTPRATVQPAHPGPHLQACHPMAVCAVGLLPAVSTLLGFVSGYYAIQRSRSGLVHPSLLRAPDLPPPRA